MSSIRCCLLRYSCCLWEFTHHKAADANDVTGSESSPDGRDVKGIFMIQSAYLSKLMRCLNLGVIERDIRCFRTCGGEEWPEIIRFIGCCSLGDWLHINLRLWNETQWPTCSLTVGLFKIYVYLLCYSLTKCQLISSHFREIVVIFFFSFVVMIISLLPLFSHVQLLLWSCWLLLSNLLFKDIYIIYIYIQYIYISPVPCAQGQESGSESFLETTTSNFHFKGTVHPKI